MVYRPSGISNWSSLTEVRPAGGGARTYRPCSTPSSRHRAMPALTGALTRRCCQISALDSTFVGPHRRVGQYPARRISSPCMDSSRDTGRPRWQDKSRGRINQVLTFQGLDRIRVTEAGPGRFSAGQRHGDIGISVTVTVGHPAPYPLRSMSPHDHELLRQHVALAGRGKVRDQPPDLGPPPAKNCSCNSPAREQTDQTVSSESVAGANCT